MTLKICSSGHKVTTKNAIRVIRHAMGLDFTCSCCKSTMMFRDKKWNKNTQWYQYKIKE